MAHVRLRLVTEQRELHPLGSTGVTVHIRQPLRHVALFAGVVALGRGRWLHQLESHDLAHRGVGRRHVALHVHVRNVESGADLVEAERFAVLGQLALDLQPRGLENIPQCTLVLTAIQPAAHRSSLDGNALLLGVDQRGRNAADEGLHLRGIGGLFLLRRHLARLHAVVDLHPEKEIIRVLRAVFDRGEVEASLLIHVVVATGTIAIGEGSDVVHREGGRLQGPSRPEDRETDDSAHQGTGRFRK